MNKDAAGENQADYAWLLTDEAAEHLQRIEPTIDEQHLIGLIQSLRQQVTPHRAQLLVTQAQLRLRAAEKFSLASDMFFTEQGLQQSSSDRIARYKASRFASVKRVADLCCGIGGDAQQLAKDLDVTAVDHDPVCCLLAERNIHLVSGQAQVLCEDVEKFDLTHVDGWHLDPDQRIGSRRRREVDQISPDWNLISGMLEKNPHACIKLSPITDLTRELAQSTELHVEFVGEGRECKQQLVWSGKLRNDWLRQATIVLANGATIQVQSNMLLPDFDDYPLLETDPLGQYLYEPHPALIAAHLSGELAEQLELLQVDEGVEYFTGNQRVQHGALQAFEIIDHTSLDSKRVKAMLREHDAYPAEIKKRGVDHQLMQRFAKFKSQGQQALTLVLTRLNGNKIAILAKRCV
jgi:hypothetical protein